MEKLLPVFLVVLMVASVSSTSIDSERVEVDLEDSQVSVDVDVNRLTSSQFTYVTSYPVEDLEASSGREEVDCQVRRLQVGSEIICEPPRDGNFSVNFNFKASDLVTSQRQVNVFRYSQSFNRPTNNFQLKVLLPRGTGILPESNVSHPVISPRYATTGSDGQRIFAAWNITPELGDNQNFHVYYRNYSGQDNLLFYAATGLGSILLALFGYLGFRYLTREELENRFEELSEDQVKVMKLIAENDGEMLQKDLVDEMEYSKAKISAVVSELVEEGLLKKNKEGRSNNLKIPRGFSY